MASSAITVDEFVKSRVPPKLHPIAHALRKVLKKYAPNAKEIMSYAMPCYVGKRMIFAYIIPAETHITLGFVQGKYFEDKYGLLNGVGKHSKNVRLKDPKDINKAALRYYIKQAIQFEKRAR